MLSLLNGKKLTNVPTQDLMAELASRCEWMVFAGKENLVEHPHLAITGDPLFLSDALLDIIKRLNHSMREQIAVEKKGE